VTTARSPGGDDEAPKVVGESRWPMAAAVLAAMVLSFMLPDEVRYLPRVLIPAVEFVLLVALILGDPGAIDRRAQWLRVISLVLVGVLLVGALWATVLLIDQLVSGGSITNSASELLQAGIVVWLSTIIAFALLYWQLDGGGAAQRAHRMRESPDLAFPQQLNPEIAPPNWRPQFVDYLYLGFTNSTAFSPTDVMPLVPWAKLAMLVQSAISFAILGLVIARAVNVFS
jgi:uncharacterized membrane protein